MADMLKIKVTKEIEFAYHDSGAPATPASMVGYDTIVLIHGHTYHAGTFKPMLDQARAFGYRIILPNRRLYPGSAPYTKEEIASFQPDRSVDELMKVYMQQGQYLLLFLYNVIKENNLNQVVLVGWSMGSGFLNTIVASITSVSNEIQSRLRNTVKSIVWWDPPTTVQGIPEPPTGGWTFLQDESLTPEQQAQAIGVWLVQYYPHKDLSKKDCQNLIYKIEVPVKTPTFTGLAVEELLSKIDVTAGANGDDVILSEYIQPVAKTVRELALFNKKTRDAWGNVPFHVIYGEESMYIVQWAVWKLEEEAEKTGLKLAFKSMPGANHFAMEDHTKLVFETLKACS